MVASNVQFYEFGRFRLVPSEHILLRNGQIVHLTPKAFEILLVLVENHGHVVDKGELLDKVWSGAFVEETNLTKNISILRKILNESDSGNAYIETFPKRGYRFSSPVRSGIDRSQATATTATPPNLFSRKRNAALTTLVVLVVIVCGFVYFYYFRG